MCRHLTAVSVPRPVKIYFGSRTHKQISQLVRELKRTEYSGVRCVLVGQVRTRGSGVYSKVRCVLESQVRTHASDACSGVRCVHGGRVRTAIGRNTWGFAYRKVGRIHKLLCVYHRRCIRDVLHFADENDLDMNVHCTVMLLRTFLQI